MDKVRCKIVDRLVFNLFWSLLCCAKIKTSCLYGSLSIFLSNLRIIQKPFATFCGTQENIFLTKLHPYIIYSIYRWWCVLLIFVMSGWNSFTVFSSRVKRRQVIIGLTFCEGFILWASHFCRLFGYFYESICSEYIHFMSTWHILVPDISHVMPMHQALFLLSHAGGTNEIARGSSHCMWVFFYFVLYG